MLNFFRKPNSTGVNITSKPEHTPIFQREYAKTLDNGIKLSVTIYMLPICKVLSIHGMLRQSNGRYVSFDPENVADRIIDPTLLPLVEAACKDILAIDRAWRKSSPSSFKDDSGITWTRT